jgi:hypothetical protein
MKDILFIGLVYAFYTLTLYYPVPVLGLLVCGFLLIRLIGLDRIEACVHSLSHRLSVANEAGSVAWDAYCRNSERGPHAESFENVMTIVYLAAFFEALLWGINDSDRELQGGSAE